MRCIKKYSKNGKQKLTVVLQSEIDKSANMVGFFYTLPLTIAKSSRKKNAMSLGDMRNTIKFYLMII